MIHVQIIQGTLHVYLFKVKKFKLKREVNTEPSYL